MTRSLSTTPAAAARTWGRGVSGLALATALFATALPAQQPATPPVAAAPAAQQPANPPATSGSDVGITTIRRNVNEVNLIFTVTDKHGRYVPNLQLHDFALPRLRSPAPQTQMKPPAAAMSFLRKASSIHSKERRQLTLRRRRSPA